MLYFFFVFVVKREERKRAVFVRQWSARVRTGVEGRRKPGWVGRPARTVIIMAAHCASSYVLTKLSTKTSWRHSGIQGYRSGAAELKCSALESG